MKVAFAGLLTLAAAVLAAPFKSEQTLPWDDKSVYEKHTIKANGIEASFMEYGAVITNLWVNDKHGVKRDIILGWDDTTQYNVNAQHPYFGGKVFARFKEYFQLMLLTPYYFLQLSSVDTLTALRMEPLKSMIRNISHPLMSMVLTLCMEASLELTV